METEEITIEQIKEMPDNREYAIEGDKCAAKWKANDEYEFFDLIKIEDSLGFVKDGINNIIDDAYHVVVFSN